MPYPKLNILPTTIPGLDTILGGGIPLGSMVMLVGAPGTGKTILLQQLAFGWAQSAKIAQMVEESIERNGYSPRPKAADSEGEAASSGVRTLYFSTLSEPHDKLMQHIYQFGFFDESLLQKQVQFLSLTATMSQGLDKLKELIVTTARHEKARLVVIDSFANIAAIAPDDESIRRFLYQLSSELGLLNATTLLALERTLGAAVSEDELALADGIIGLYNRMDGARELHRMEVRKMRGMKRLSGTHSYEITSDGLIFYPRLETRVPRQIAYEGADTNIRLTIDMPELETMLGGGVPATSSTIIAGALGTGKTLLSLHYLMAGIKRGEPGLYVGFHESRAELVNKSRRFKLDMQAALDSGMLHMYNLTPVEVEPDVVAQIIHHELENGKIKRFVMDGFSEVERTLRLEGRSLDYISALISYLKEAGVTTLYTHEIQKIIGMDLDLSDTPYMRLAENLVLLKYAEYKAHLHRIISILKMRDSPYDQSIREFTINDDTGITILNPIQSTQGLLTGLVMPQSDPR